MPKYQTQIEAFQKCKKEGKIIITEEINIEKIKSTLEIAESDIKSATILENNLSKDSKEWNSVFKLYYDALHELTEAFLKFDKIKTDNHQCLFAYLCETHKELEFNWEFFEKVRTKRNGINYYSTPITHQDFKETEIQFILYLNKLKEEIKKKI